MKSYIMMINLLIRFSYIIKYFENHTTMTIVMVKLRGILKV